MLRIFAPSLAAISVLGISICDKGPGKPYPGMRVSPKKSERNIKTIHFVRHAEGHHNVAGRTDPAGYLREDLEDAELTDFGKKQCQKLNALHGAKVSGAQLVVFSPMNRTIQTASLSFPELINKVPWVAVEQLREQSGLHPCDRRKPISEHKKTYPHVDFGQIKDNEDKLYRLFPQRERESDVTIRARKFMQWLKQRPESEIIVVSHHKYLQMLFRELIATTDEATSNVDFTNCEMRTFVIDLSPEN
jgi:broad specificity phosphatase PhoE